MKKRSHERLGIQFPFRTLGGHGNRVRDVRLAAIAKLSQVSLIGKPVRQANLFQISRGQVVKFRCQTGETGRSSVGGSRTGRRLVIVGTRGRNLAES